MKDRYVHYLIVNEIFTSVSGEVGLFPQGSKTLFIRFAGCNLRCSYCDTSRAQERSSGHRTTAQEIIASIQRSISFEQARECRQVLLTGGEPLLQDPIALHELILVLKFSTLRFRVQVETNGSIVSKRLLRLVDSWVVDFKLDGSGMMKKMLPLRKMLPMLTRSSDWLKFVIRGYHDYETALGVVDLLKKRRNFRAGIAFSAADPITPRELHRWMKDPINPSPAKVILNIQIHKLARLQEPGNP